MGTRVKLEDGTFGAYEWMTYQDVYEVYDELARGIQALRLLQPIEGIDEDGKEWRLTGIWSQNCAKWHMTSLASMVHRSTIVGFNKVMKDSQVEECLNLTRL